MPFTVFHVKPLRRQKQIWKTPPVPTLPESP